MTPEEKHQTIDLQTKEVFKAFGAENPSDNKYLEIYRLLSTLYYMGEEVGAREKKEGILKLIQKV